MGMSARDSPVFRVDRGESVRARQHHWQSGVRERVLGDSHIQRSGSTLFPYVLIRSLDALTCTTPQGLLASLVALLGPRA